MKKLIFLSVIFMLGVTVSNAQGVKFGPKAGVNFSGVNGDDVDNVDSRTGLNIGAAVSFGISELFSVQPEVTYSMRGFTDGEFDIKLDYVDIPVMADFTIAEGLSLQGGPIFGINITATQEVDGNESDLDDISTLNIAAAIGAQYELPIGLFFNIRYDMGFNDIIDIEPSVDAKNCNLNVSAGFWIQ